MTTASGVRAQMTALIVAIAATSCSFFTVGPPADYRPEDHGAPACNPTGTLALDALGAVFGALFTIGAESARSDGNERARGFVVVGAIGTALHGRPAAQLRRSPATG